MHSEIQCCSVTQFLIHRSIIGWLGETHFFCNRVLFVFFVATYLVGTERNQTFSTACGFHCSVHWWGRRCRCRWWRRCGHGPACCLIVKIVLHYYYQFVLRPVLFLSFLSLSLSREIRYRFLYFLWNSSRFEFEFTSPHRGGVQNEVETDHRRQSTYGTVRFGTERNETVN